MFEDMTNAYTYVQFIEHTQLKTFTGFNLFDLKFSFSFFF
jgi:hypothetical protein